MEGRTDLCFKDTVDVCLAAQAGLVDTAVLDSSEDDGLANSTPLQALCSKSQTSVPTVFWVSGSAFWLDEHGQAAPCLVRHVHHSRLHWQLPTSRVTAGH